MTLEQAKEFLEQLKHDPGLGTREPAKVIQAMHIVMQHALGGV